MVQFDKGKRSSDDQVVKENLEEVDNGVVRTHRNQGWVWYRMT